jgi:hypothetical protein
MVAVPSGGGTGLGQLLPQLLKLAVNHDALLVAQGAVQRLQTQLAHALLHVRELTHSAFCGLQQVHAGFGIAKGLAQALDTRTHGTGHGHTGRIVSCRLNAQACAQLAHGIAARGFRFGKRQLAAFGIEIKSVDGHKGTECSIKSNYANSKPMNLYGCIDKENARIQKAGTGFA